jgi:hypothetical protein
MSTAPLGDGGVDVCRQRDELREKVKALQADLDRTRAELDRLRAESEAALTRERRAAAWRDSLLRAELLDADRDRSRLQAELADLRRALAPLAETPPHEARELQETENLERLLAALYASRSWRLTAPVRWFGRLIRGTKGTTLPDFSREHWSADELRRRTAAVHASRSWRLAAPLRFISRRIRAARNWRPRA